MPELITPSIDVHASFVEAMEEFAAEGRTGDDSMVGRDLAERSSLWKSAEGFADYVAEVVSQREENASPPDGFVASTTLWWVDGVEYIGRIAIRHRLTPWLREYGGHIGYDIRRSARRRGHATALLGAALPYAHLLGVDPVLITCDEDNDASRKVIEANGGVFEDARAVAGRPAKWRYWAPTS